jgi:hypothetical protein
MLKQSKAADTCCLAVCLAVSSHSVTHMAQLCRVAWQAVHSLPNSLSLHNGPTTDLPQGT